MRGEGALELCEVLRENPETNRVKDHHQPWLTFGVIYYMCFYARCALCHLCLPSFELYRARNRKMHNTSLNFQYTTIQIDMHDDNNQRPPGHPNEHHIHHEDHYILYKYSTTHHTT